MRFGRPIAAAGAAALVASGLALTSPALADTADGGFTLNPVDPVVVDPASTALTVSGSACISANGVPGTVAVGIASGHSETIGAPVYVDADAEGNWTATLDVAAGVAQVGGDTNLDPWFVVAECASYNADNQLASEPIILDGTQVAGTSQIVSSDTNGDGAYDTQTYEIDMAGFTPGETVTFTIVNQADSTETVLVELVADATGRIIGTGPMPSGLPDGQYLINAVGSRYGEGFSSKPITVTNGWFEVEEQDDLDDTPATPTAPTTTAAAPSGSTASAKPAASKKGSGSGSLASTGAGLGLAVVAAGLVGGGALLVSRRRRA